MKTPVEISSSRRESFSSNIPSLCYSGDSGNHVEKVEVMDTDHVDNITGKF